MKTLVKIVSLIGVALRAALILSGSVLLRDSIVELIDRKELCIALASLVVGSGMVTGFICVALSKQTRKKMVVGLGVYPAFCAFSA